MADQAAETAGDEGPRMTGRGNVGIIQHGMTVAAQAAVVACLRLGQHGDDAIALARRQLPRHRSEEHTSELQSLMRISYAVFCLKKKKPLTESSRHDQHAARTSART